MTQDIRDLVRSLKKLFDEPDKVRLRDVLHPWSVLGEVHGPGLLDYRWEDLVFLLKEVYSRLAPVLDVLDEDQTREAACRAIGKFVVFGPKTLDEETQLEVGLRFLIAWENDAWVYYADPKTRIPSKCDTYVEARAEVAQLLETDPA